MKTATKSNTMRPAKAMGPGGQAPAGKGGRASFIYAPEPAFFGSGGFGSIQDRLPLGRWWGDQRLMIAYVRRATFESPLLQSYLRLMRTQVVGKQGIRPTFSSVQNARNRKKIEKAWKKFARRASITGKESLTEILGALVETVATDGRTFAVLRIDRGYPDGMAIQMVSRDYLATDHKVKSGKIHDGVEYNDLGQIVNYWFDKAEKPENESFTSGLWRIVSILGSAFNKGREPEPIAAGRVFDIRKVRHADDADGDISWLLPAVLQIRGIADFDAATIGSMQAAARKMGFITNDAMAPGDRDDAISRARLGIDGDNPVTASDTTETVFHGEATAEWDNVLVELYKGQNFVSFDPTMPQTRATEFRKEGYRTACAGLGVDYASMNSDAEGVNFSSLRHFALQTRDTYEDIQEMLIDRLMRPLVEQWIDLKLLEDRAGTDLAGVSEKSLREARDTTYRARHFPWVDPAKDTQQNRELVEMGAKSTKMVAAENGIDLEDVLDDQLELAELITEKSKQFPGFLELLKALFGKSKSAPKKDGDTDDEPPDKDDAGDGDEPETDETESDGEDGRSATQLQSAA